MATGILIPFLSNLCFLLDNGLSYTSFSIGFQNLEIREKNIELTVSVKNTGERYSGREVVQVYITPPRTRREKNTKTGKDLQRPHFYNRVRSRRSRS